MHTYEQGFELKKKAGGEVGSTGDTWHGSSVVEREYVYFTFLVGLFLDGGVQMRGEEWI